MKRYRVLVGDNSVEDRFGTWVPAEVAQALYDALVDVKKYYSIQGTGKVFHLGYRGDNERNDRLDKALSLADGEE